MEYLSVDSVEKAAMQFAKMKTVTRLSWILKVSLKGLRKVT